MSKLLVHDALPEERELDLKKRELDALQFQLAERELELATFRAELSSFEQQYLERLGSRFRELDQLLSRIAQLRAAQKPDDADLRYEAEDARERAQESAAAFDESVANGSAIRFAASDSLKSLYRSIAKTMHPDFAVDPGEKRRRSDFMVRANRAYANGDESALKSLLDDWNSDPELVPGDGVAAELVRTIRKIAQIQNRLVGIHGEFSELLKSNMYRVWEDTKAAQAEGRDLLGELSVELDRRIAAAREQIGTLERPLI